jgi:hypothetical protein
MAHAQYIAKASKVSKSSSGPKEEINFSIHFHSTGIPLLVSPALLRRRNLGQIDLARLIKNKNGWILEVGEVKSSSVGEEAMGRFQLKRISCTQNFLSGLFGHPTKLLRLVRSRVKPMLE